MSSVILHGLNQCESTNTLFGGKADEAAFSPATIGTARGIDICFVITFLVVGILGGGVGLSPAGAYALLGIGTIGAVALIVKGLYDRKDSIVKLCTCGDSTPPSGQTIITNPPPANPTGTDPQNPQ